MAGNQTLIEDYAAVQRGGNWRSWPGIRHLRAMRYRRLQPFGGGKSEGLSVIRYYWADFLMQHRADVQGRALEIGETTTIRNFGGDRVTEAHALDLAAHSPEVKVVADLSRAEDVPGEQYDCFVNQFTTAVIYDIRAALYHAVRLLKPGGVLLINFWCLDYYLYRGLDMGTGEPLYMYHWFTPVEVDQLLDDIGLDADDYSTTIYGNLLTRMAFLMNVPAREFTRTELDHRDPGQPLLICARIVRPPNWNPTPPQPISPTRIPAMAPAQVRADTGHYGDAYVE
ncbi:MAG: class I SAM-dependent methyltransferase [Litorilinea sp.]